MVPLRLADRLTLTEAPAGQGIRLRVTGPMAHTAAGEPVPHDERNLVVRALESLTEHFGVARGADLLLEKYVPSQAGLGGGSSDAAAALLLANHAWGLRASRRALRAVAAAVGSDVPFFLGRGAALCRGRGELVERRPAPSGLACVVAKPAGGLSTARVYQELADRRDPAAALREPGGLLGALAAGDWRSVARQQFNRLEEFAVGVGEGLRQTKDRLCLAGVRNWMLTGSGSAFFALTPNLLAAQRVAARVRQRGIGWAIATATD